MEDKKIFTPMEAAQIAKELGVNWQSFTPQEFLKGLNQELEHGLTRADTNVSNDDGLVLGKIVLTHLRQLPDYYTRLEQMVITARSGAPAMPHYHGRKVRQIFLAAAILMVLSLPFIGGVVSFLGFLLILIILILGILAGMTSPQHPGVIVSDMAISVLAFIIVESYAVHFYSGGHPYFFVASEVLSLMFLMAIYYATKTWRGMQGT